MTSTAAAPTQASTTTQVYRIFIRATPQAIWDAITKPEWTQRFGYGLRDEYDALGLIPGDNLNPQKARILLMLALTRTSKVDDIKRIFLEY